MWGPEDGTGARLVARSAGNPTIFAVEFKSGRLDLNNKRLVASNPGAPFFVWYQRFAVGGQFN